MKPSTLRIAGFGFRSEATLESLIQALDQLIDQYGSVYKYGLINRLAAARSMLPLVEELGRLRNIEVIAVVDAELSTVATLTHSTHSLQARGTGSVAEAVALLAAGPNARLVGPRIISADRQATAALALGFARKLPALDNTALKIASCASPIKILIYTT
ncbi:precorrin methylase [Vreelandella venusta]|jgi:cobalt-precorrin 5A hydrolase|uniref:Precorrin methylase n=1 Tax=Halomonas hydrothermalis TaxID=115561 RepID=A0A6F8U266_9GAMM|nr:cobalamin biosynthesis protein [Halomonas hydrothermalis]BCB07552.1 precorrin methylase [Halomonas hydrothermalis]